MISYALRDIRIISRTDVTTFGATMSIWDVEVPVLSSLDVRRGESTLRGEIGRLSCVERALTQLGEHRLIYEVDGLHKLDSGVILFLKNSITVERIGRKIGCELIALMRMESPISYE